MSTVENQRPQDVLTPAMVLTNTSNQLGNAAGNNVAARANEMLQNPTRLADEAQAYTQSELGLRETVRKTFIAALQSRMTTLPNSTKTMQQALDEVAARSGNIDLNRIIDRLKGDLPQNPGPGARIDAQTGNNITSYTNAIPTSAPHNAPEGFVPASRIYTDIGDIQRDQVIVSALLRANEGNPEHATALRMLNEFLDRYARTDPAGYLYAQQYNERQNSVTNRGLSTMGKLLGMAALLGFAVIGGTVAIANNRMPLGALVALGLAGVIGDARMRRQFLSSRDQIAAEELVAVLSNPEFKEYFVPQYGIYAQGEKWAPVVENLFQNSSSTQAFIKRLNSPFPPRDPVLPRENGSIDEISDYLADLGVNSTHELYMPLRRMFGTRHANMGNMTDFERFTRLLSSARSETSREAVIQAIRTNRGARLIAGPITPSQPAPPTTPQQAPFIVSTVPPVANA